MWGLAGGWVPQAAACSWCCAGGCQTLQQTARCRVALLVFVRVLRPIVSPCRVRSCDRPLPPPARPHLYRSKCKLYRYDNDSGEWKERGVGQGRILQHKANRKIRFLMRQDKTLKIRSNHISE